MKKTVILAANTDWYLYNFRRNLAQLLLEHGFQVVAVCPMGEYVPELLKLGCLHADWQVGRKSISPIKEYQSIRQLKRIYQEISPDLIHQHTLKSVIYGNIAIRGSGFAVVNSIPGRGYIYSSNSLRAKLIRPILDSLLRYALDYSRQRILFENQADMQYFLEQGFIASENAHLVKSVGVDHHVFKPTEPPNYEIFTVGFVGRMLWDKGAGTFVEAAKIIHKLNPGIRMVLIGAPDPGNPGSIPIEQLQSWVKNDIIEWLDWQKNMPAVYANLHVLAYPTSYAEGVPTVLLEAGASARALIASDTPGCREVIEDGISGYLIPENNAEVLAEKILTLSQNEKEFHRIRKNAYVKISLEFSKELVNEETLLVYQELLEEPIQGLHLPVTSWMKDEGTSDGK
jgi:glycosyltransferase involved in cell wall biosynthesis